MMAAAAHRIGLKVCVLDNATCPCSGIVEKHLIGDFKDNDQVLRLEKEKCDVVTVEIEHINVNGLEALEKLGVNVQPSSSTLRIIQDKLLQKQHLLKHNISVGPFIEITSQEDIIRAIDTFGLPLMLKSRKMAYDGRGNFVLQKKEQIEEALQKLDRINIYAEKWVDFTKELSIMVARSIDGTMVSYPVVQNIHKDNICHTVIAPAPISLEQKEIAEELATKAVSSLQGAGIFGVEMFLCNDGQILINEIAPRPHNSGHYTIEACVTSQFENHLRAIIGLPLGDTSMIARRAIMINILGKEDIEKTLQPLELALSIKGASVHWYGKKEIKPQRKMGHITIVGNSLEELIKQVGQLKMSEIKL